MRLSQAGALLLLLVVSLAIPRATAPAAEYDLTVIAMGVSPTPTQVAATYAHAVKHDALRTALDGLAHATGRRVESLVFQEVPLYPHSDIVSTGAEFASPGLVVSGLPLPVEALARALPEWRHLRIAFITGKGFRFAGPPDGIAIDGARARLMTTASGYEYDVERTPEGATLPAAPVGSATAPLRKARALPSGILLVVLIASVGALFALWRWRRPPRPAR
jgi:hypothetical protein